MVQLRLFKEGDLVWRMRSESYKDHANEKIALNL